MLSESLGKSVQNILCIHVLLELKNGFISKIFSCKSDFMLTPRPDSSAKNQSMLFVEQQQFKLRYLLLKPLPVQPLQWERDELMQPRYRHALKLAQREKYHDFLNNFSHTGMCTILFTAIQE